MEILSSLRRKPILAYSTALILFAAALGLRFAINGNLQGYPFVTFIPAVVLTAVIAGVGPGLLLGVLSALAAAYFFIPPYNSFIIEDHNHYIGLGFFVFIVVIDLILVYLLNKKIDTLNFAKSEVQRLADYQKVLFAELQHRVANNLAFVYGLLSLQKRELEKDSPAAKILDLAGIRVMAMSRIHRTLHDEASLDQPLTIFLKQLTLDVLKSAGIENAVVEAHGDEVRLDLDSLTTLALLVSELVTNCAKHVLLKGVGDRIILHVEQLPGSKIRVEVADNGPGLPIPSQVTPANDKLGQAIIQGLIKQLSGQYEVLNRNGATAIVTFPIVGVKSKPYQTALNPAVVTI